MDHLHRLDLSIRLLAVDMATVIHKVLDQFPGGGGAKVGGVVLLLKHAGLAVQDNAVLVHFLLHVGHVTGAVQREEEGPV